VIASTDGGQRFFWLVMAALAALNAVINSFVWARTFVYN
jgi:hypothetical protein